MTSRLETSSMAAATDGLVEVGRGDAAKQGDTAVAVVVSVASSSSPETATEPQPSQPPTSAEHTPEPLLPLTVQPPPPLSSSPQPQQISDVFILGFKIPAFQKNHSLRIKLLIASIITVYLLLFILQESIFKKNKCDQGGFVTWMQFVMFWAFGLLERRGKNGAAFARRGPLRYHCIVGFFCVAGYALSTYSLQLLNFPTWLLFKSARVLATMLAGVLILGRKYGPLEYSGVLSIVFGLAVFTLGDWTILPNFNVPGIVFVVLALALNAAQDNFQEKGMREYGVSENEMVVFSYGLGSLMLLPIILFSGEFVAGIAFCIAHPIVFLQIIVATVLAYSGVVLVLTLLNQTSALVAVITTSCRKGLSIILSFLIFRKPFSMNYIWGTLFVFAGILLNFYGKRKRTGASKK